MNTNIIFALIGAIAVIIAFVIWCKSKKFAKNKRVEISELKCEIKEKDKAIEEAKSKSCKEKQILMDLLIMSQIGYNPTDEQKLKMLQEVLENKRFTNRISSKISAARSSMFSGDFEHLNGLNEEFSEICDSLAELLSSSISRDKNLYPKFEYYFSKYGFNFCGQKIEPEKR